MVFYYQRLLEIEDWIMSMQNKSDNFKLCNTNSTIKMTSDEVVLFSSVNSKIEYTVVQNLRCKHRCICLRVSYLRVSLLTEKNTVIDFV